MASELLTHIRITPHFKWFTLSAKRFTHHMTFETVLFRSKHQTYLTLSLRGTRLSVIEESYM